MATLFNTAEQYKYPNLNNELTFANYIESCRALIEERRLDLKENNPNAKIILNANLPFEAIPTGPIVHENIGVLMIHGLFDCPFSFRDISLSLMENGIYSRAILLPGHGTRPSDLLNVTYQDWVEVVDFSIDSLRNKVDKIYLMGYSTGAALAVHQAIKNPQIAGIMLMSPAIKVKAPVEIFMSLHRLTQKFHRQKKWVIQEDEEDYAKYMSVCFNSVDQVDLITKEISIDKCQNLKCPIFMALSENDETVSAKAASQFFKYFKNPMSELLLYSTNHYINSDNRIKVRSSSYPNLQINNFSHIALPFRSDNFHYGQSGDYPYASHIDAKENVYGAYNLLDEGTTSLLYRLNLIKHKKKVLTYNPDFDYMVSAYVNFILKTAGIANS